MKITILRINKQTKKPEGGLTYNLENEIQKRNFEKDINKLDYKKYDYWIGEEREEIIHEA